MSTLLMFSRNQCLVWLIYSVLQSFSISLVSALIFIILFLLLKFDFLFLFSSFSRRKLKSWILSFYHFLRYELKPLNFSLSTSLATCHKFWYTVLLSFSSKHFLIAITVSSSPIGYLRGHQSTEQAVGNLLTTCLLFILILFIL